MNAGDVEQAGGQLGPVATDVAVVGIPRVGHDARASGANSPFVVHPSREGTRGTYR